MINKSSPLTNIFIGVLIFVTFVLKKTTIDLWRTATSTRRSTRARQTKLFKMSTNIKLPTQFASTHQVNSNKGENCVKLGVVNLGGESENKFEANS